MENQLKQYQRIIETMANPVGMVDRNLIYQYVNEPYCQALNKSASEIIGHSVPELFGQTFFEGFMEDHYKRCFGGDNVHYQTWFDFAGWGRRYMDICYYPFREADGLVAAVVVNVHDITELKELELELRQSEGRFRAFMDHNPAAIYMKNIAGQHTYANKTLLKFFRKSLDEFIGTTSHDLFPQDLAERLEAEDHLVRTQKVVRELEEWSDIFDGDVRWWKEVKFPVPTPGGEILVGGIAMNITARKRVEEELRRALVEVKELKDRIEQENIYLRQEFELSHEHGKIIGASDAIRRVLARAELVAGTRSTVLITGETGTGKELLAYAIHELSPRKQRPMIKVNCSALPASLIESELFGREKGAYTGALARQVGRFEVADGSTIFLDEIGELPLELQVKLLRVLQDGEFERLGSNRTINVDVRVIAATNRDLTKAVREGRFREDLYYRLNVFPINVPPLRERPEDIPQLVWAFVRELGETMGKSIDEVSRKAMDALQRYSWPGNVRELRNLIERAMIVTKGPTLLVDLPEARDVPDASLMTLEEIERKHILNVLEKADWRIRGGKGAAEILGLKPTTLESRMRKLDIKRNK
ncbi:MAG: sigma 54-interacting transcriptional regulator [Chloroflexota bacterium]